MSTRLATADTRNNQSTNESMILQDDGDKNNLKWLSICLDCFKTVGGENVRNPPLQIYGTSLPLWRCLDLRWPGNIIMKG